VKYATLSSCIEDLRRHGQLIDIKAEVNPFLEMAAIHLRVHASKGPAILFHQVKGTPFKAVSNIFGTTERSNFIFRHTIDNVKKIIAYKGDPLKILQSPRDIFMLPFAAFKAIPKKSKVSFHKTTISQLPQIHHWKMDGGAFITLPIVYSEHPKHPKPLQANIGMYRIQISGNDYIPDKEIGLHYQLHRGIGVHQSAWNELDKPMKVSIFVGGPPSHTFSAVMPLPEGMSELTFAGVLGGRRFRYFYDEEGYCLSSDADFVITGEVFPNDVKTEGPFGDHLGYYSLKHDFPVMKVHNVYHKQNAIWPFTVVGRPPQEDTAFGHMIHEITGDIISKTIPGLHEVHAVDASGVHPLLLAIGSERYTPYIQQKKPQEILTIANAILGFGQMSLAKYLFICDKDDDTHLHTHDIKAYFIHLLQRIDWTRDIHFHTQTTLDTLDYSGESINAGSKVVFAACGEARYPLLTEPPADFPIVDLVRKIRTILPGIFAFELEKFKDYPTEIQNMAMLTNQLAMLNDKTEGMRMLILCDDADFTAKNLNNFLWVTFTRSNPSHDIYGVDSFTSFKHWGCNGSLLIDARRKPHHAPELLIDEDTNKAIDKHFAKGGALYGLEK
jgi:4-hydroxy-3-polyprenylbenzoate decarboxylase